ncbi:type 2 lantipeptide synthetase LanM, partial [Enterococcus faecalis]|nr:type 2 lantipeptide synthetase LanM [Enterococcus faecalis]EHR4438670.1 type 2 lantipeptide synthetase LanM [Enterococcus faecalis]
LLSEITEDEKYRKFSLEIFEKLSEEPYFNFRGFGHGIYSYVHLLSKFNRIDKANSLLHKIKESYFEEEPKNNSWCKGTVGELLATIELYDDNISNIDINKTIAYKNKDCLCHGNAGTLEGLIQLAKKDPETYQYKKNKLISYMLNDFEKNNTLKVAGSEYLESLGFFVGISGVGYELLRNLDSEIPNALLFEL